MPLASMKLEPREAKDPCACPLEQPREDYPWGLRIHLEAEQLAALGIKEMPPIGTVLTITAMAKVVNASVSASEGSTKEHRSLGLQITDMNLEPEVKRKSNASVLYGDKA